MKISYIPDLKIFWSRGSRVMAKKRFFCWEIVYTSHPPKTSKKIVFCKVNFFSKIDFWPLSDVANLYKFFDLCIFCCCKKAVKFNLREKVHFTDPYFFTSFRKITTKLFFFWKNDKKNLFLAITFDFWTPGSKILKIRNIRFLYE